MSTIRCIYHPKADGTPQQPSFPATAQHPDAVRYLVGNCYVDALGGTPTQAELDAILAPSQDVKAACAVDAQDRLLFEVSFDHENRIRALELKLPITRAQFRDALITRWKALNP